MYKARYIFKYLFSSANYFSLFLRTVIINICKYDTGRRPSSRRRKIAYKLTFHALFMCYYQIPKNIGRYNGSLCCKTLLLRYNLTPLYASYIFVHQTRGQTFQIRYIEKILTHKFDFLILLKKSDLFLNVFEKEFKLMVIYTNPFSATFFDMKYLGAIVEQNIKYYMTLLRTRKIECILKGSDEFSGKKVLVCFQLVIR